MKYMLLIYSDETAWTEREREAYFSESIELTQQLQERGQYLGASPLHSVTTATTLDCRNPIGPPHAEILLKFAAEYF